MKPTVFFSLFCFILCSCQNENKTGQSFCEEQAWYKTIAVSDNEDAVMMRLSAELIPNPELQAHYDHNEIIAFAIDHGLDIQSTTSGLFYLILDEGLDHKIDWGDQVAVHYRGSFLDGTLFDSSCRKGKPLEIYVGNMIDGWNEGLQLVGAGGRVLLLVPSRLAYGEKGLTDGKGKELAPPDQVLIFEVEVVRKLKSAG